MSCPVCEAPAPLGCEFCPVETPPIIDRDPGDETAAVPVPRSRSYRATYRSDIAPDFPWGGRLTFRDFIGPDGFLHAVELAELNREEGETLLNVTELT